VQQLLDLGLEGMGGFVHGCSCANVGRRWKTLLRRRDGIRPDRFSM